MGTIYALCSADLLYSYIGMSRTSYTCCSKENKTKIAESFKFNFRYIYDVLSLRNVWFCILNERDIMDTILKSFSYLDLYPGSGN